VPVDRSRGDPGGGDPGQQGLDLAGGDLGGRTVSERGHDVAVHDPRASLAWDAGLGQQVAVVGERRGLGALDLGLPDQERARDLAEAHPVGRALADHALPVGGLGDVADNDLGAGLLRSALVEEALTDAPATLDPPARGGVAIEPRRSDAQLDLLAVVAKLGLVVRLVRLGGDDQVGARIPR